MSYIVSRNIDWNLCKGMQIIAPVLWVKFKVCFITVGPCLVWPPFPLWWSPKLREIWQLPKVTHCDGAVWLYAPVCPTPPPPTLLNTLCPPPVLVLNAPTQKQSSSILCKTCKAPKISCTRPGLVRGTEARQVQGAQGPLLLGPRAPQSAHTHAKRRKIKTKKERKRNAELNHCSYR